MLVDSVEALESEASNEPSARTSIDLDDEALSQDSKEERERQNLPSNDQPKQPTLEEQAFIVGDNHYPTTKKDDDYEPKEDCAVPPRQKLKRRKTKKLTSKKKTNKK